jgi:hypothetical protein
LSFYFTHNNARISYLIWDRFAIQDGKLEGDKRSSKNLDKIYDQFLQTDDVIWGRGNNYTWEQKLMGDCSYKLLVLNYGLIVFIIICLSFSLIAFYTIKKPRYLFMYLFLLLGMIYHRPGFIFDPAHIFIMIASIYAIQQKSDSINLNIAYTSFALNKNDKSSE